MKCISLTIKSLLVAAVSLAAVACSNGNSKVAAIADESNKSCPMNMGDVTITKIDYDAESNNLQYHVVCNSDTFDINKFKENGLLVRSVANSLFQARNEKDTKQLLFDLTAAESGIKYIYYDFEKQNKVECVVSFDELRSILDVDKVDSDPEGLLKEYAKRQNEDFPKKLDNITTALNVEVTDTALVHHFAIQGENPEELVEELNVNMLKFNISIGLQDIINRAVVLSCIKTKHSLVYSYKVEGTDKALDVVFSSAELEKLLAAVE